MKFKFENYSPSRAQVLKSMARPTHLFIMQELKK